MKTKEINAALKAGQQVTFHQHVSGTSFGYDHRPVLAAKTVKGQVFVKGIYQYRGQYKVGWFQVIPALDDYVSITLSPGVPEVSNVVSN